MATIDSSVKPITPSEPKFGEKIIELGNRALGFMEKHPAVPVIAVALGVFGSMGRTARKAGWTPEQVVGLGKAFPVQISIPTLSL